MTAQAVSRERMRANRAAIRQVPCPACHAPRPEACVQPSGRKTPHPHPARRHAAAQAGVYTP